MSTAELSRTDQTEPATIGRPNQCTPEVTEVICHAVRNGLPLTKAAALAGVDYQTLNRWRRKGCGELDCPNPEPYIAFWKSYQKAKADLQISMLSVLTDATKGGAVVAETTTERPDGTVVTNTKYSAPQWTPAAWILERRFPQEFGRQTSTKMDVSGTVKTENLNVNIDAQLSDEQSAQLVNLLRLAATPIAE